MPLPERLVTLLTDLESADRRMPPTLLYNEGWLLRLLLDAAQRGLIPSIPLARNWFCEAQLPTPFGGARGPMSETNTRADGVMGDFVVTEDTRSGLKLTSNAKRFEVFEAKMYSPLSARTRNAPGYDQAARTVACMARALQMAGRPPRSFERIIFHVVAPQLQIDNGLFAAVMQPDSIRARIEERISQFTGQGRDDLNRWRADWALPLLETLSLGGRALSLVSWESLITAVRGQSPEEADVIEEFYSKCRQNRMDDNGHEMTGRPVRGKMYVLRVGSNAGRMVQVCFAGRMNSRVFFPRTIEESFLVRNLNLQEIADTEPGQPLIDLARNRQYVWVGDRRGEVPVRILNAGNCNSRVVRMDDQTCASFNVPNHHLRIPETAVGE
jgi:hypothetical protein